MSQPKDWGFLIWAVERAMSQVPQLDGSIRLRCDQVLQALRLGEVAIVLAEEISVQLQRLAMSDSPIRQDGLQVSCLEIAWGAAALASGYRSASGIASDLVSMARCVALREWEEAISRNRAKSATEVKHALKRSYERDAAGRAAAEAERKRVSEMGGDAWS